MGDCCCSCNNIVFLPPNPASYNNSHFNIKQFLDNKNYFYSFVQNTKFSGSSYTIIYFHGNAQDMGLAAGFISSIMQYLPVNVILTQYPGYGFIKQYSPSIDLTINYTQLLAKQLRKFDPSKLIVMGRSLGSGPACLFSSQNKVKALILMSPYLSLRQIALDIVGCPLGYFMRKGFDNQNTIRDIKCQTLIIHGRADQVIGIRHGQRLADLAKPCTSIFPVRMTHNSFDYQIDIIKPIKLFLEKIGVES